MEEMFEDTKRVIRSRQSKTDRQHIGQKKKDKQWSTKYTQKTKDCSIQTPLKIGVELRSSWRVCCSCSTSDTHRATVKRNTHHL